MRPLIQWLGLVLLLWLGFRAGPGRTDSPVRQAFSLPTPAGAPLACLALLPQGEPPYPVVIYAHAVGGTLTNDEPGLRRLAAAGLAAVSVDYAQTNPEAFPGQLQAVLAWVNRQAWANTNAMVWMGLSLGANHFLEQARRPDGPKPQMLVLMSSRGWTGPFTQPPPRPFPGPVLLLHGQEDTVFPWTNDARLFTELSGEGTPAAIKVFPGLGHGLEPDRAVIIRATGDYCLARLGGTNCWRNLEAPAGAPPGVARRVWWLFAGLWLAAGLVISRGTAGPCAVAEDAGQRTAGGEAGSVPRLGAGGRVFAAVLAAWVLAVGFIYLMTPRLPAGKMTLAIARGWIVPPEEQADFDYLARQPGWAGQPLQAGFDQIQWAGRVRHRFSLRTDDRLYRECCLSPFVTGGAGETADWRPALATEFLPCLGAETNAAAAAALIARHLRESVSVADVPRPARNVSDIWRRRLTDVTGFETIYVAALRATGIPARLDANQLAELWNGAGWQTAPRPALMAW